MHGEDFILLTLPGFPVNTHHPRRESVFLVQENNLRSLGNSIHSNFFW